MAFKLPTWDDIKKQMALSLICLLVTIPLSVIGQKVLAETHLFDPTARWLSERVVSVGPNTFAWIVAGVISLVLYGFTMQRVWSPRYRDRYHRDLQAETAPVASLGIKVTRAPVRDMSFREALRRLAYTSAWAHAFKHPQGDALSAAYWPQAVHREFCQQMMDADHVTAWGIRSEPGKPRENGHTAIPKDFWRTAQFDVPNSLEGVEFPGWATDAAGVTYTNILFTSAEIEALWPKVEGGQPSSIETAAKEMLRLREAQAEATQAEMDDQVRRTHEARQAAEELAKRATEPPPAPITLKEAQRPGCRHALDLAQGLLDKEIAQLMSDLLLILRAEHPELRKLLARSNDVLLRARLAHANVASLSRDREAAFRLMAIDLGPLTRALRALIEPVGSLKLAKDYTDAALREALKIVDRVTHEAAVAAAALDADLAATRKEHFGE